jgi:hypothetical protein
VLIAYGPAEGHDAIIGVDLDEHGRLVIVVESASDSETLTLPASAVTPEFRALASQQETAA